MKKYKNLTFIFMIFFLIGGCKTSENKINELSIGMSNDYNKALDFNPAYIRLGTILFGKR